jgi:hypothetical protein
MKDAAEALKQAVRLNPGLAAAHNSLGNVYLALQDAPAAQAAYEPPLPPRTKWTRRVLHPVLIGHTASLSQVRAGRCAHARLARGAREPRAHPHGARRRARRGAGRGARRRCRAHQLPGAAPALPA